MSGGAGTVAFLVGCGFYDLGAFQVRQFLLTSYAAERALLTAVAEFFDDAELIVTYNGKTFDVPVMETRWMFHRMEMPLDGVPHFDALHTARRLWKSRTDDPGEGGCGCRRWSACCSMSAALATSAASKSPPASSSSCAAAIPSARTGLEHNRLDLVSLAAVTARAVKMIEEGADACDDGAQALAVGRIFERAGLLARADECYRRAAMCDKARVRCEGLYRLALRRRRERRFAEAADYWREIVTATESRAARRRAAGGAP